MARMRKLFPLSLVMSLFITVIGTSAADFNKERLQASAKYFRVILTAELEIENKKTNKGDFLVYLVGDVKGKPMAIVDAALTPKGGLKIRKTPVKIEKTGIPLNQQQLNKGPAAIFITDNLDEADIALIMAWGIKEGIVVFSPYEGDVEKGVTTGMAVGAKVLPYINATAMKKSKLNFNPMLLRIGKIYE